MQTKTRSEMDPKYTWDLTPVFESDAAWRAALEAAEASVAGLSDIPGTLGVSAAALKAGLDRVYAVSEAAERVYAYAMLKKSEDGGDPARQEMEARALSMLVALQTATAFVNPEILAIPADALEDFMKDDGLAVYRHIVDDVARGRAHILDAQGERMLAMLGDAGQTPSNAFEMLTEVDMRFPPVHDESGAEVPLTHGSFGVYRVSRSQAVRREAFETYFGEYRRFINTLAATYAGSVKLDCFNADVRGYESACAAALFGDNVPVELYDTLVEAVHGALGSMREYIELRKSRLGIDTLNLYDLYVPIVEDVEIDMPFEEAKRVVKAALRPLGEAYQALLDRAFEEKWIDVYENQGKHTGAFAMGVYGAHPYVLLNYTGKLDDAFTLAHELGHAMHSYFSDHAQPYASHDYSIFVAEVASTVNEVLLTRYLLSVETDPARRAMLLNHFLEGFRTTVFRQTLFAEFERRAHALYQSGTPLTAEALSGVYHELNALYYAGCEINDFCDVEWARIPHFYTAFYVYQYATGFSSAVAIADGILKSGDASAYLRFLTTGGSDYPIEELKLAGVDLTRPDAVADALKVFGETLKAFEETVRGLGDGN